MSMRDKLARLWRGFILITTSILMLMISVLASLSLIEQTIFDYPLVGYFLGASILVSCYIVHELGHVIGAWLVGWRVHLFAVGIIGYAPRARRFHRDINLSDMTGGVVLATPPKGMAWGQGDVIFTLGGVAANFFLGIVLIVLAKIGIDQETAAFPFLIVVGEVSIICAAVNLMPIWGPGKQKNDGAQLISAIRGIEPSPRDQLKASLLGMVLDEVPLKEWDRDMMDELLDGRPVEGDDIDQFLFRYLFTRNDFQRAREIFEHSLEEEPGLDVDLWFLYAFILCVLDSSSDEAAGILRDHAGESGEESPAYLLVICALNHLNGDKEAALAAVRKMHARVEDLGLSPDAYDKELLRAVETGDKLPHASPDNRLRLAI